MLRAVPVFGSSTKVQTQLGLRFVPSLARAAQEARSLTSALSPGAGCHLPSMVPASVSGRAGPGGLVSVLGSWSLAATSRQMSAIQNLRKSLVRNWEPVCSLVGGAISGAEFAPFHSPLPPTSGGGWAGPLPAGSSLEFLSLPFVPKQCHPLLSIQSPLAGGRCEHLGYFAAGSCF